jgi:hypothetical protein
MPQGRGRKVTLITDTKPFSHQTEIKDERK